VYLISIGEAGHGVGVLRSLSLDRNGVVVL